MTDSLDGQAIQADVDLEATPLVGMIWLGVRVHGLRLREMNYSEAGEVLGAFSDWVTLCGLEAKPGYPIVRTVEQLREASDAGLTCVTCLRLGLDLGAGIAFAVPGVNEDVVLSEEEGRAKAKRQP